MRKMRTMVLAIIAIVVLAVLMAAVMAVGLHGQVDYKMADQLLNGSFNSWHDPDQDIVLLSTRLVIHRERVWSSLSEFRAIESERA